MHYFMAITIFFTWVSASTWLSFFQTTAHYMRMIIVTFRDITAFLIVQAVFMLTFGFTLYFLNQERVFLTGQKESESVADLVTELTEGQVDGSVLTAVSGLGEEESILLYEDSFKFDVVNMLLN